MDHPRPHGLPHLPVRHSTVVFLRLPRLPCLFAHCMRRSSRHVKCDEAKPSCRRCISGRRECRGYDFGSPDGMPIGLDNGSGEYVDGNDPPTRDQIREAVARRRRCIAEPEPPDWECMEAARYCTSLFLFRQSILVLSSLYTFPSRRSVLMCIQQTASLCCRAATSK